MYLEINNDTYSPEIIKNMANIDIYAIFDILEERTPVVSDSGVFTSLTKPRISIRKYAIRLYKYMLQHYDILIFAIYYMALYVHHSKIVVNSMNIHRLLLTSSVIAHKFWDDNDFSNKVLANIGGIKLKELNFLEHHFLKKINWKIYRAESGITGIEFIQIIEILTSIKITELSKLLIDRVKFDTEENNNDTYNENSVNKDDVKH